MLKTQLASLIRFSHHTIKISQGGSLKRIFELGAGVFPFAFLIVYFSFYIVYGWHAQVSSIMGIARLSMVFLSESQLYFTIGIW